MNSSSSSSQNFDFTCAVCGKEFPSYRSFSDHFSVHSESDLHDEAPAVEEDAGSSFSKGANHSPQKLMMNAAGPSFDQPPPPPKEGSEMKPDISIVDVEAAEADHIPTPKEHSCDLCGRRFSGSKALGGHKAHHSMRERKRRAAMGEEGGRNYITIAVAVAANEQGLLVYDPVPPWPEQMPQHVRIVGPRPCPSCGIIFSSGQAVGAHKRYCRGPPPVPWVRMEPRIVNNFNLNELPPEE